MTTITGRMQAPIFWPAPELSPITIRMAVVKNRVLTFPASIIELDFAAMERRMFVRMSAQHAIAEIAKRAGCSSGRVVVFWSSYADYPPTLQRVGAHGKILKKRRSEKAHGSRRVVVGRQWLQKHEPELWAALIGSRLVDGNEAIFPNPVPRKG